MTRLHQFILASMLGALLGGAFFWFMVFAAERGAQEDFGARFVHWLGATRLSALCVGAAVGLTIGLTVSWLGLKELADLKTTSQQMEFAFHEEAPPEALAEIRECIAGLEIRNPRHWMTGVKDGVTIGLLDCTIFDGQSPNPSGAYGHYVAKTIAVVLTRSPAAKSFEVRPLDCEFELLAKLTLSPLFALLNRLAVALRSGSEGWARFHRHYEVRWLGRPAETAIITRLLGIKAVLALARRSGWTLVVDHGALAAWQLGSDTLAAAERPGIVRDVLRFYHSILAGDPAPATSAHLSQAAPIDLHADNLLAK